MSTLTKEKVRRVYLNAETAADLMTSNPLSIRDDATVADAVCFLTDKGISAAPVIDASGRPVGVLSRSDILVHDRETNDSESEANAYYGDPFFPIEKPMTVDFTAPETKNLVRDVMTPVVFSVGLDTSSGEVAAEMARLKIHRLFVSDEVGTLVGVVSSLDVLRHLRT